mmetsp:Transcript_32717/g.54848  ORF Transcript_32717/g.54848 Transcript_32717/m.54848 type:complete len:225 (-) Transcript_32717:1289-1963(-)
MPHPPDGGSGHVHRGGHDLVLCGPPSVAGSALPRDGGAKASGVVFTPPAPSAAAHRFLVHRPAAALQSLSGSHAEGVDWVGVASPRYWARSWPLRQGAAHPDPTHWAREPQTTSVRDRHSEACCSTQTPPCQSLVLTLQSAVSGGSAAPYPPTKQSPAGVDHTTTAHGLLVPVRQTCTGHPNPVIWEREGGWDAPGKPLQFARSAHTVQGFCTGPLSQATVCSL